MLLFLGGEKEWEYRWNKIGYKLMIIENVGSLPYFLYLCMCVWIFHNEGFLKDKKSKKPWIQPLPQTKYKQISYRLGASRKKPCKLELVGMN